jgi:VanZ family protein
VDKLIGFTAIAYTCALSIGSLVKPVKLDTNISNIDKLLHLGAYFGLAILWLSYFHIVKTSATQKWAKPIFYIAIALALVVYGIVIELLQGSATTYRTPDVWDVLANSIGVILGSLTFLLFFKKFKGLKS